MWKLDFITSLSLVLGGIIEGYMLNSVRVCEVLGRDYVVNSAAENVVAGSSASDKVAAAV